MNISTPDLCDAYPDLVKIVDPIFRNYGGKSSFGGEIVTIKCFEDNSRVKESAGTKGEDKVMVVDGGGSLNKALLGDLIALTALKNGWAGFIIYGCIRDVEPIGAMKIGVKALNSIPLKTQRKGEGENNVQITFGGVNFNPGKFVYCDETGIIVSSEPLIKTED
ncbi:MAG: putative 4-hydroxy-4-methyl-2-oxoglutarate aldolase [Thermodesulfobacteriales bacterium]|nr:MAG: putative 4-hydroxy-4-methyl-2-oxoglutarate aldolase [Thermodesulfobacteriales bacterium]